MSEVRSNVAENDIELVKEYLPVNQWHDPQKGVEGKMIARIVERRGRRFLDIRQYLKKPDFEGFSKYGIRLSVHEVDRLMTAVFPDAIDQLLKKTPCETKPVTNAEAPPEK